MCRSGDRSGTAGRHGSGGSERRQRGRGGGVPRGAHSLRRRSPPVIAAALDGSRLRARDSRPGCDRRRRRARAARPRSAVRGRSKRRAVGRGRAPLLTTLLRRRHRARSGDRIPRVRPLHRREAGRNLRQDVLGRLRAEAAQVRIGETRILRCRRCRSAATCAWRARRARKRRRPRSTAESIAESAPSQRARVGEAVLHPRDDVRGRGHSAASLFPQQADRHPPRGRHRGADRESRARDRRHDRRAVPRGQARGADDDARRASTPGATKRAPACRMATWSARSPDAR